MKGFGSRPDSGLVLEMEVGMVSRKESLDVNSAASDVVPFADSGAVVVSWS